MKNDFIVVNNVKYPVKIFVEDRRNIAVSIRKKAVIIRAPCSLDRNELAKEILKMKNWAQKKLMSNPVLMKKDIKRTYADGDTLKIGDEEYLLRIDFKDKQSSSAKIIGKDVFLNIASCLPEDLKSKHISTLLSRCVARKRINSLKLKIGELNQNHFNKEINKVFFKNNKSNWGSCSSNGNINISTRLLFAPDDVLEYVCIHELAHLIEPNHSEKFWALVEKAMPSYVEKKKWLKENEEACTF